MQLVKREYRLAAAVAALGLALLAAPADAAQLSGGGDLKAVAGESPTVQNVHWRGRYYRPYSYGYYAPRYYRHRHHRPYYYYGHAPRYYYGGGYGYYAGPRYYRHWW